MATEAVVNALLATDVAFGRVDNDKLTRKTLGEESLAAGLTPRLQVVDHTRQLAKRFASAVHNDSVTQMTSNLTQIANILIAQQARPNAEYISQREPFFQQLDAQIEETRRWLPYFVTAAVIERGFLEDEGIRQESMRAIATLQEAATTTIATIKEESERTIANAKQLAEEIEARARRTAAKISVEEAQRQFGAAAPILAKQVRLWAALTIVSMTLLVGAPFLMAWWPLPAGSDWPVSLYHTLVRVAMVSGVAAFAVLSIRMLRAYLHIAERNRHRIRVANSVESFVNSAIEPQQRDLILARLVEAIVDFGDSGLIRHEHDEVSSPTLSADGIGRILSALTARR